MIFGGHSIIFCCFFQIQLVNARENQFCTPILVFGKITLMLLFFLDNSHRFKMTLNMMEFWRECGMEIVYRKNVLWLISNCWSTNSTFQPEILMHCSRLAGITVSVEQNTGNENNPWNWVNWCHKHTKYRQREFHSQYLKFSYFVCILTGRNIF